MKKTRLTAVLWDMDGTLVDTEPYWHEAETAMVEEFGGTWTLADQRSITGFDLRAAAFQLQTRGGVELEVDEIVNRMLDHVIEQVRLRFPWRPGAKELLNQLHEAGVPCALVTMSWRRLVDAVVHELPHGSFKSTIAGDEVEMGKPHPRPYIAAAEALGVEPYDCVAIEDSPTGLRSAVAAGCVVVVVPNELEIPADPKYTLIESLTDVTVEQLADLVPRSKRRPRVLALLSAFAVVAGGVAVAVFWPQTKAAPVPPPTIAFDAWAPSFLLPNSTTSLTANAALFGDVMPFWYTLTDPATISLDPAVTPEVSAAVIAAAHQHGAKVTPTILDKTSSGVLAGVLADPVQRRQNVDELVKLVADNGYDGIDVDYEQFGYNDPRSTWETTSANFVTFVGELSTALHGAHKTLSVTLPPIYVEADTGDRGYWVYDYAGLAPLVDRIRILAYDYSTSAPGPIAPLSFVRNAIAGAKAAVKDSSKLSLAVPMYGHTWLLSVQGTCPPDAPTGRTDVTQRGIDDLLARRSATPIFDPTTGESSFSYDATYTDGTNSCVQSREAHYVDAEGTRLRIDLARTSFLGSVSLWALGQDSPATWTAITSLATPKP